MALTARGHRPVRGVPAASGGHRLPPARLRRRGRGRRAGDVPALAGRRRRPHRGARGLADEGPHQPVPQPAHLGPGAARDLRGPVAARAAARRGPDARPGRHRRAARIGLLRGAHPHGAPVPERAGGLRAARGLRLPAPGDRRDPRHHRGRQPADLPPGQAARRGRQGPHRGRRGRRPADRRGVPRGRHQRPDRAARAAAHRGRHLDRRRRREGPGPRQGVRGRRSRSRSSCAGLFKPGEAKRALVGGTPEIYAWTANGDPAVVAVVDGRVVGVMCLEVTAEGIAAFRNQVNPDKLDRATARWAAADHGEPLFNAF